MKLVIQRSPGRPALPSEQRTITRTVRLTPSHWEQYNRLGGARWLRRMLDALGPHR